MSDTSLKDKSEKELQEIIESAYGFAVGNHYLAVSRQMQVELVIAERSRRYFQASEERNQKSTKIIVWLTVANLIATIVNVILAVRV